MKKCILVAWMYYDYTSWDRMEWNAEQARIVVGACRLVLGQETYDGMNRWIYSLWAIQLERS